MVTHAVNGFKWQASIGAQIDRQEVLKPAQTAVVNGRLITGPALIARAATLKEISFVPFGADHMTLATVAASNPPASIQGTAMDFAQWLKAKGFDLAALSADQQTTIRAAFDSADEKAMADACAALKQAMKPPPVKASDDDEDTTAAGKKPACAAGDLNLIVQEVQREQVRQTAIADLTARYKLSSPLLADQIDRLAETALKARATTTDQYELALLRAMRGQAYGAFAVHSGGQPVRDMGRVLEASACLSGRISDPEKHFDEKVLEAAHQRFPHGIGLRDILMLSARVNGYGDYYRGDERNLLRAAFGPADGFIRADGGASTISVPNILSNVANKFLFIGFKAVEDTWRQISVVKTLNDFKQTTTVGLTGDLTYDQLGKDGEIKHGTLGEIVYHNQAATYGRMLGITRQDIINDDLGALTLTPSRLGRGAALKLNNVFWTTFLGNLGTTFTAGRELSQRRHGRHE